MKPQTIYLPSTAEVEEYAPEPTLDDLLDKVRVPEPGDVAVPVKPRKRCRFCGGDH